MFTEITWATYLRLVAALLFIYYTVLILKFYFPQIRTSFSSIAPGLTAHDSVIVYNDTTEDKGRLTSAGSFTAVESGNDYEIIEEIVERVKSVLQHAADSTMATDEVLSSFRTILSDYPALAKSTFRPSINEFIASESGLSGFPDITQEMVAQLWQTV